MKKILAIFSIVAIIGCSLPASAKGGPRGNNMYRNPPGHQKVIVNQYYNRPMHMHRPPVREHYYYHTSNRTGAIVGGLVAGAAIAGIVSAIVN